MRNSKLPYGKNGQLKMNKWQVSRRQLTVLQETTGTIMKIMPVVSIYLSYFTLHIRQGCRLTGTAR